MATAKTSYKPLSYVLFLTLAGLFLAFVMSAAAPLLYVFLLAAIIPATAFLYLRAKWFAAATPVFFGIVLLLNYNIIFLLCLPLLVFGIAACIAAAKSGKLFFGVAIIIAAVFAGLALPVWTATLISGETAGDTVAEYILTREDDSAIMNMAKNFVYEAEVAEAHLKTPLKDVSEIEHSAALKVDSMSADEILSRYSVYVKDTVNAELFYFIFSTGAMIAMTVFLILVLLLLSYQYLLKTSSPPPYMVKTVYTVTAPRHIIMPRRYALFVLVPYIVFFLLSGSVSFFEIFFESTYYGVILVPFGFAGIGLAYYFLARLKLNLGYCTLILSPVIILAFLGINIPFLIFAFAGIVDYFLNLRFIVQHYRDKPAKKQAKK